MKAGLTRVPFRSALPIVFRPELAQKIRGAPGVGAASATVTAAASASATTEASATVTARETTLSIIAPFGAGAGAPFGAGAAPRSTREQAPVSAGAAPVQGGSGLSQTAAGGAAEPARPCPSG